MAKPNKSKTPPAKGNGSKTAPVVQTAPAKAAVATKPAPKAVAAPVKAAAPKKSVDTNAPEVRNAIAQRAFELSKARGFQPGHELEDWLSAEREVLSSARQ